MRQTARLAGVGLAVLYFCSAIRADTAQRGVSSPKRTETETERVDDDAGTASYRATHVASRQSLSLAVTWPPPFVHSSKSFLLGGDKRLLAAPRSEEHTSE